MDKLFAAVNVSGLQENVTTVLISFVGIALVFCGYRWVRRTLAS